jgi:hypothetical protein
MALQGNKRLLGFQLADKSGANIQGDPGDPTDFTSWQIMDTALAVFVIARNPGFLLMPIYDGDIEKPEVLSPSDVKIIRPKQG